MKIFIAILKHWMDIIGQMDLMSIHDIISPVGYHYNVIEKKTRGVWQIMLTMKKRSRKVTNWYHQLLIVEYQHSFSVGPARQESNSNWSPKLPRCCLQCMACSEIHRVRFHKDPAYIKTSQHSKKLVDWITIISMRESMFAKTTRPSIEIQSELVHLQFSLSLH